MYSRAGLVGIVLALLIAFTTAAPIPNKNITPPRTSLSHRTPPTHSFVTTSQASFDIIPAHILTPAPSVDHDAVDTRELVYLARRNIFTKIRDAFRNIGHKIKEGFQKFGHAIKNVAQKIGNGIKHVAQKIGNGIKHVAHKIKQGFQKFGHAIKHVAQKIGNGIKHVAHKIKQGFQKFGHAIKHVAQKIGNGIKHVAQKIGHGIKVAAQKVGHFIKTTGAKIAKVGLKIISTVQKVASKVVGFIPGVGKVLGKVLEGESAATNALSNKIHVNIGGKLGQAMEGMDKARKIVGYIPRELSEDYQERDLGEFDEFYTRDGYESDDLLDARADYEEWLYERSWDDWEDSYMY